MDNKIGPCIHHNIDYGLQRKNGDGRRRRKLADGGESVPETKKITKNAPPHPHEYC